MKIKHFLLSLIVGAAVWAALVIADPHRFPSDDGFALGLLMLSAACIGASIAFENSRPGRYLLIYLALFFACAGVTDSVLFLAIGLLPGCTRFWYLQKHRPDVLDDKAE